MFSWNFDYVSYPGIWRSKMFHTPSLKPGKCFIPWNKTLQQGMQVKKEHIRVSELRDASKLNEYRKISDSQIRLVATQWFYTKVPLTYTSLWAKKNIPRKPTAYLFLEKLEISNFRKFLLILIKNIRLENITFLS